jgi:hypothetical protein
MEELCCDQLRSYDPDAAPRANPDSRSVGGLHVLGHCEDCPLSSYDAAFLSQCMPATSQRRVLPTGVVRQPRITDFMSESCQSACQDHSSSVAYSSTSVTPMGAAVPGTCTKAQVCSY